MVSNNTEINLALCSLLLYRVDWMWLPILSLPSQVSSVPLLLKSNWLYDCRTQRKWLTNFCKRLLGSVSCPLGMLSGSPELPLKKSDLSRGHHARQLVGRHSSQPTSWTSLSNHPTNLPIGVKSSWTRTSSSSTLPEWPLSMLLGAEDSPSWAPPTFLTH